MYWQTLVLPPSFWFCQCRKCQGRISTGSWRNHTKPKFAWPADLWDCCDHLSVFCCSWWCKNDQQSCTCFPYSRPTFNILHFPWDLHCTKTWCSSWVRVFLHKFHFSLPVCLRLFTCSSDWASYTSNWFLFFLLLLIPVTAGITGLSLHMLKDNWSSDYQRTNSAGMPDPDGETFWDFK